MRDYSSICRLWFSILSRRLNHKRDLFVALCFGVILFLFTSKVHAAGTEITLNAYDLVITIDGRWAGGGQGGYYPIRIRLTNRGEPRNLTFRFTGNRYESGLEVIKTVGAPQNATLRFTLYVPLVGQNSGGVLRVEHDGRALEGMSPHLALTDADHSASRPSLLIISPKVEDAVPFENAVTSLTVSTSGGHYGSGRTEDHEVIPPNLLPDSWIGYTTCDLVAVPLSVLEKLPTEERTALLQWVHTGGNLIVYEVGQPVTESQELAKALGLNQLAAVSPNWESARPGDHQPINVVQTDAYGNVTSIGTTMETVLHEVAEGQGRGASSQFQWKNSATTFAWRRLMQGLVVAFPENPFPGTPHDWAWLLRTIGPNRYEWSGRHGLSARRGHEEFLQFLIPGIGGVPVYSFLVLITLFAVTIGPLNYYLCWKRKRLFLLVLTIPAIALMTTVALFSYSIVAHGFGIKSRVRSLTLVDQQSKSAVSTARVSLYAGLAPTDGLRFSSGSEGAAATAVFPIWHESQQFEGGRVNWTETQALEAGWLRSRTRTQFLVITHRPERGRLEIKPVTEGRLPVSNGFEYDLQSLIVSDADGSLYYAPRIPAGGSTELTPMQPQEFRKFVNQLSQYPLELPEGMDDSRRGDFFDFGPMRSYRYYGYHPTPAQFSRSILEEQWRYFKEINTGNAELPPRSYVALFGENPGIELGVPDTTERASVHVLYGAY